MSSTAKTADRLTALDIAELKKSAIAAYPGTWLHHFGRTLEEEVLRRHNIPFTPITGIGE